MRTAADWQQALSALRATRESSDARRHLLREYDRYPQGIMIRKEAIAAAIRALRGGEVPMDSQGQSGTVRDSQEQVFGTPLDLEEGPGQSLEERIEETRHALFDTYAAAPGPITTDEHDHEQYVCPAHRWLGLVQEAAGKLMAAADQALAEMSPSLKKQAKAARFISDGWQFVAEAGAPEARRLMQVRAVAVLLNGLVDELANEGRPQMKGGGK